MPDRVTTRGGRWSGGQEAPPEPRFPYARAFVGQFAEHVEPSGTRFEGRVEHLQSGRRVRFESGEALVSLLAEMLVHVGSDPDDEAVPAPGKPRGRGPRRPRGGAGR